MHSPDDVLAKLRPGIDGVVLSVGKQPGHLLPQVWEQLPDKEQFLDHLAEKAGLESTAWKSPGQLPCLPGRGVRGAEAVSEGAQTGTVPFLPISSACRLPGPLGDVDPIDALMRELLGRLLGQ